MREFKPEINAQNLDYCINTLESIIKYPSTQEKRPCHTCTAPCECSNSTTCGCQCSWECPYLMTELSSDPVKYPIEQGIIPLVFALNSTGFSQSFWSCEGHEDNEKKLYRLPRVQFYSSSLIFPSLLIELLNNLYFKKIISSKWKLLAQGLDDVSLNAKFEISPDVELQSTNLLTQLRDDIKKIAGRLYSELKSNANRRLIDAMGKQSSKNI